MSSRRGHCVRWHTCPQWTERQRNTLNLESLGHVCDCETDNSTFQETETGSYIPIEQFERSSHLESGQWQEPSFVIRLKMVVSNQNGRQCEVCIFLIYRTWDRPKNVGCCINTLSKYNNVHPY